MGSKAGFSLVKQHVLECNQGAVRTVKFNRDGNYCLTCGSNKTIKLWNPVRKSMIKEYKNIHGSEILDVDASHDNARLVSGGLDRKVFYVDVASGQVVRKIRAHEMKVNCVKFNNESNIILSSSVDSTVKLWDCLSKSYDPIQTLSEAKDNVTCLALSDYEILTGSADCRVRRYDIRVGRMYSDFLGLPVSSVAFTKDGQCTLTSLMGGPLRLLDKDTGEQLNEFSGHKTSSYKLDCCMNSSDTHVLSGSEDGRVYVWDLIEGKIRAKLEHDGSIVHALAFHHSKELLLTACETQVYVWSNDAVSNTE